MSITLNAQDVFSGAATGTFDTFVMAAAPTLGQVETLYVRGLIASAFNTTTVVQTGVTWTKIIEFQPGASGTFVALWYGICTSGGASNSVRVNYSGVPPVTRAGIETWTFSGTPTLDVTLAKSNNGTSTTPTCGSTTPPAGVECLFISVAVASGTFTAGSWTLSFTSLSTINNAVQPAYLVGTASGSYAPSCTFSTSSNWTTVLGVVKNVGGGGSVKPCPIHLYRKGLSPTAIGD